WAGPPLTFSVLTGRQKLSLYLLKKLVARWIHPSFEKRYVVRTFRASRWRSVPWCRSTNAVLIVRLAADASNAAATVVAVPKITRVVTPPTRPPFRVFCTLGYVNPPRATLYRFRGRPRPPVPGGPPP